MNLKEINEEGFQAYENVRASGVTNMCAINVVSDLSGLSRERILTIIYNYGELMKKYPNVKKVK